MPNLNFYYLTQDKHIPVIPDTPPSQSDQFHLITKENIDCITHEENLHFMHASFNDKTMGIYFLQKNALDEFIQFYETKLGVCLNTRLGDKCPQNRRKPISTNEECPSYEEITSEIGRISETPVYAYGGSIRDFVKNFSTVSRDQQFQVAPEYLALTFHSLNLSSFQITHPCRITYTNVLVKEF